MFSFLRFFFSGKYTQPLYQLRFINVRSHYFLNSKIKNPTRNFAKCFLALHATVYSKTMSIKISSLVTRFYVENLVVKKQECKMKREPMRCLVSYISFFVD